MNSHATAYGLVVSALVACGRASAAARTVGQYFGPHAGRSLHRPYFAS